MLIDMFAQPSDNKKAPETVKKYYGNITAELVAGGASATRLLVVAISSLTVGGGFGVHHGASFFKQGLEVAHGGHRQGIDPTSSPPARPI